MTKTIFITSMTVITALFFLGTNRTYAQITTGSIIGTIKQLADNKPAQGVSVTATHVPSGTVYTAQTNNIGDFSLNGLQPGGPYTVITTYMGATDSHTENIFVTLGSQYELNLTLHDVAKTLDSVVVQGRGKQINSGPSTNMNVMRITSLPTINRSIADFTQLSSYAGNNFSFGGRDGRYNAVTVDGANMNNNMGLSNGLPGSNGSSNNYTMQPISLDAIDQISLQISPFDIRQSGFTGAYINAITKSGSNELKVNAYEYYRNQAMNGTKVGNQTLVLNTITHQTYGANVGGAIIKNKLFYFVSVEGETVSQPLSNFVPSNGSNSGSNVSRVTTTDLDQLSNFLKTTYNYNTGGYDFSKSGVSQNYKILGRIDWNINRSNKLMLRYNYVYGTSNVLPSISTNIGGTIPMKSARGLNSNSFLYTNSLYQVNNTVASFALDLHSKLSYHISNQLLATYSLDRSTRGSNSSPFPFVDILDGNGNAYISLGYEPFSYNNYYSNPTISVIDNLTITKAKHTITAGASFEWMKFTNSFMPGGTSYYLYNSITAFETNQAPSQFTVTYPFPGKNSAGTLQFGRPAAYAQDEINIASNFKLTIGLRIEMPLYLNTLTAAADTVGRFPFQQPNGAPITLNPGRWPNAQVLFSPRISFNWKPIISDKSLVVRGGAGIFTGQIPFVWMVAQANNAGVLQNTYATTNPTTLANFTFNPDPNYYVPGLPQVPARSISSSLVTTVPSFKMPQVLRFNLAVDKTFAEDYTLTLEGTFTKDINAVLIYNPTQNIPTGTMADGRNSWWNPTAFVAGNMTSSPWVNNWNNGSSVLTNTNKGYGYTLTAQVAKRFAKNWLASLAYTYTNYQTMADNPGTQTGSAWSGMLSQNGNNYLNLTTSSNAIPHRITAYANYTLDYKKYFGTSISLSYVAAPYARYSTTYSGDINGDGNKNNDLMYVPKGPNDISFSDAKDKNGNITMTAQQQSDLFFNFVQQDKFLNSNRGKIAPRNGGVYPWVHLVNFRALQNFYFFTGSKATNGETNIFKKLHKHTIQLSYEIVNLLNLLNKNWGLVTQLNSPSAAYNSMVLLATTGKVDIANNRPYFNYVVPPNPNNGSFVNYRGLSSVWGMNIGIRYIF